MKTSTLAILIVMAGATLYVVFKTQGGAQNLGAAAVNGVVDAAAGGVIGIGEAVGIPRTNMTECEKAMAEGRTWDASFACPAGTFIKHVFS